MKKLIGLVTFSLASVSAFAADTPPAPPAPTRPAMPGATTGGRQIIPGAATTPTPNVTSSSGAVTVRPSTAPGAVKPGAPAVKPVPSVVSHPNSEKESIPSAVGMPISQPLGPDAYQEHLKLGDYIDLDDSIKNEMYGTIDFPNADLKDIIKAISKLAGKNFILDRKIEGRKVTILSPQPVTKQEAYNAFLSALYMNDLTLVSMGRFLKIVEARSALQSNIRVFVGDYAPANEEIVTVLYPLKYLNAEEIQRFITDLVPRNGRITFYPNTNTLVMTDTGLNLRRIIAILKSVDVPGHEDQLETLPIHYANAKQIAQLIDDILEAQTGRRIGAGPPGSRAPQKTRGGGTITKIVPDDRTNSLIVLANGRGVQELRSLISKLDSPNAAGGGNIHIYYCKNAVADELASTINSLISGAQANAPKNPVASYTPPGGLFPSPPGQAGGSSGGGQGIQLQGNIKVTADKPTNSLVIVASGSDFSALKAVLKRLDIPRRQVYVEGTIMEMSLKDNKSLGVGINIAAPGMAQAAGFIPSTGPKPEKALAALSRPAALAGIGAGLKAGRIWDFPQPGGGTIRVNTLNGLIQALVDSNQGQVLHRPQILTTDNQEATIKVRSNITVSNGTSTTATNGLPVTNTTYGKEHVNIQLKITPQLGESSELVKLKVDQSVDSYSASNIADQVDTTERQATTNVVVRDGDTVVIGGLQQETIDDTRSRIPILGDIPVLGWLFKGMKGEVKRSDLVLFLTPRIINEYHDLLRITSRQLDNRLELGKTEKDPKDLGRDNVLKLRAENRQNMLRNAPKHWGFRPQNGESDGAVSQDEADGAEDKIEEEFDNHPVKRNSKKKDVEKEDSKDGDGVGYVNPENIPANSNTPTASSSQTTTLDAAAATAPAPLRANDGAATSATATLPATPPPNLSETPPAVR